MGVAGIEHGVGEALQGNHAPDGIMILSWPDAAFFRSLSGEPAMTVIPNLFVTGVLAIALSLIFATWAVFGAQRRRGGLVLMLLAMAMLLFGGGIFPPVLGFFIGLAATRMQTQPNHRPLRALEEVAGKNWTWLFVLCCLAWLILFPGIAILDYFFGVDNVPLTLVKMLAAFALLFVAFWSSGLRDRLIFQTANPGERTAILNIEKE